MMEELKDFLNYAKWGLLVLAIGITFFIVAYWALKSLPEWVFLDPYEVRLTQVADCQAREQFTTDQCFILVGDD